MATIGAFEAKTHFSHLLDRVQAGETIIITRHGQPVAALSPVHEVSDRQAVQDLIEEIVRTRAGADRGGHASMSSSATAASIERLVLDCSVSLPWYLEDERTEFTDGLLFSLVRTEAWVPALWRIEFSNALLVAERRQRITAARRLEILQQASALPFHVDAYIHPLETLSGLAAQLQLTTYDTVYLELAQRRGLALATLDAALVKAARSVGLPLLTDLSAYPAT